MMNITIYEVFELNRILHSLLEQQTSYKIQIAFKIHSLIKWLDETETFLFERMKMLFKDDETNIDNPLYVAFLNSQIPFTKTDLKIDELLNTDGNVKLAVNDVGVLNKMLWKTED